MDHDENYPISASNFAHGVCLVNETDDRAHYADYLLDKTGKIVWSVENDGWNAAKEFFGEGNVEWVRIPFSTRFNGLGNSNTTTFGNDYYGGDWFGGFAVVEFKLNTYDDTKPKYGVLDSTGAWAVEPGEDAYCFGSYCIVTTHYVINYRTGEVTPHEELEGHDWGSLLIEVTELDDLFNTTERDEYLKAHDNLQFEYVADEQTGQMSPGFVDANGSTKISLANYNRPSERVYFSGGYCSLPIWSQDDGGTFVTVLDTAGNEQFSPLAYEYGVYLPYSECAFMVNHRYFDNQGKQLGSLEVGSCTIFHGGRAWAEVDNEWHCLASDGTIVF